jgi:hypothetical protein
MRTCVATLVIVTGLSACGGSGMANYPPPAPPAAPAITAQPMNQSVPMGLPATYSVSATGSQLTYQWAREGTAIAGATNSSYTTPATAFADTGAQFTVTVSNAGGAATSTPASLTVTARAPAKDDLRFQQVDAPSTVSGWGNAGVGVSTNLLARGGLGWSPALGTAFYVGGGNCSVPPVTDGTGCTWFLSETPVSGASDITAAYASDTFDDYAADLGSPSWPTLSQFSPFAAAGSSQSVINSLDLEPASNLFALGFVSSPQASGYSLLQESVAPADLPAALTELGAAGRVVTAISYNAGLITIFAYAWQADTATLYDATAVTVSPADTAAAAAALAAQGYIITASGLADSAGDAVLVGTRVQGDTMARPFMAAGSNPQYQQLEAGGYAVVAVIQDPAAGYTVHYLYER